MKIHSVGAESYHVDGWEEANSRFSQFCECAWKLRSTSYPYQRPALSSRVKHFGTDRLSHNLGN